MEGLWGRIELVLCSKRIKERRDTERSSELR